MPVYECPDCEAIVSIHKNAPDQECYSCHRKVKANWQSKINYDGKPIGFVHYREDHTTSTADIYLDLQTLIISRRDLSVNKNASVVVS